MNQSDYANLLGSLKQETRVAPAEVEEKDNDLLQSVKDIVGMTSEGAIQDAVTDGFRNAIKKRVVPQVKDAVESVKDTGRSMLNNAVDTIKSTDAYKLATKRPNAKTTLPDLDTLVEEQKGKYKTITRSALESQGRARTTTSDETKALSQKANDYFGSPDPEGDLFNSYKNSKASTVVRDFTNTLDAGNDDPFSIPRKLQQTIGRTGDSSVRSALSNTVDKVNPIGGQPKASSDILSGLKSEIQQEGESAAKSLTSKLSSGEKIASDIVKGSKIAEEVGEGTADLDPVGDAIEGVIGIAGAVASAFVHSHSTVKLPVDVPSNFSMGIGA